MNKLLVMHGSFFTLCAVATLGLTYRDHGFKDFYTYTKRVFNSPYHFLSGVMGANFIGLISTAVEDM